MSFLKKGTYRTFKMEAAIVLTGIVLMLVGGVFQDSHKEENPNPENIVKNGSEAVESAASDVSYSEKYEAKIEKIIKGIDGVKGVKAAVYVKSEGVKVPAENYSGDKTVVTEKEGEANAEEKRDVEDKNVVIVKDSHGNESAVFVTEKAPEIEGIAVCIEGNLSKALEEKILKTLMALFNVPPSKISITA